MTEQNYTDLICGFYFILSLIFLLLASITIYGINRLADFMKNKFMEQTNNSFYGVAGPPGPPGPMGPRGEAFCHDEEDV